jgi:Fanconi anemia group M protein
MPEPPELFKSGAEEILDNPLLRKEAVQARAYQLNITREALKKNTLVVLPTALGKTVISVLVASHFLFNYRDKKILVMAPTKPLVLQHRDTFMRFLKLRPDEVQVLTGKSSPAYRLRAWEGAARVYFATPQVVCNDHERGVKLNDFTLLVFDECHRARKNYAYTRVAEAYIGEAPYPVILAMTASPGADRERIRELCRALYIERIEARTEEDPDVKPYISPVGVEWKLVDLPESYSEIHGVLREMLDRRLKSLSTMGVIRKNPRFIFRNDLLEAGERLRRRLGRSFGAERGRIFGALILQSSAMTLYHALGLLESQGPETLRKFLQRVRESKKRSHRSLTSEFERRGVFETLVPGCLEEHPKMAVLERVVRDQVSANPSSKIMVFTQYRDTSTHIVERLSGLGYSAERFVGQAGKEGEAGMSQEQQAALLKKFREGEIRILVATSIGEEGLDIPSVDLVLFYEPVPSEIRYIQRKGRTGRGRFGKVLILAAKGTLDVSYLRSSGKKVERMRRVIEQLNVELSPIMRFGQLPEPSPMSPEEILEAEASAPLPVPVPEEVDFEALEKLRLREFNREVRRVSKKLLDRVFRSGFAGTSLEEFTAELEEEGIPPAVVKEAAKELLLSDEVRELDGKLVPAGAGLETRPELRFHSFEVERVLAGRAILLVDQKWRTVLTPESYDGPKHFIKKGVRFRAAADFYKQDGKLHAKIYGIERVLD